MPPAPPGAPSYTSSVPSGRICSQQINHSLLLTAGCSCNLICSGDLISSGCSYDLICAASCPAQGLEGTDFPPAPHKVARNHHMLVLEIIELVNVMQDSPWIRSM
jgi:hypothetical protein